MLIILILTTAKVILMKHNLQIIIEQFQEFLSLT